MTYHIYPSSQKHTHWVFAFYGFGQQATIYDKLAQQCSEKYGFIVIDLPYETYSHGETKSEFMEAVQSIIKEHNIEKISGISYSMGSRYHLILVELMPALMQKVILVAPDGIIINFWNRLVTSTLFGHSIFKYLMFNPNFYLKMLHILYKIKLLPLNLYLFTKMHVRNKGNALRVYNGWMNMKNMIPNLKKINQEQLNFKTPMIAIFGKYDFVINKNSIMKLRKEIPNVEIKIVEKGHKLLDNDLFSDIASYL